MSGLNLTPNPMVIAVQGGIFLSALVIIKKNFLEPYVKLRSLRDQLTTGVKGSADGLNAEAEQMASKINQSTESCIQSVKAETTALREQASEKRQELVTAAEKEAEEFMKSARDELRSTLREEGTKVEANAVTIAKNIENMILNS